MGNQAYELPLRRVGLDVTIWPAARIITPERISLGDSVIIDDFVMLMAGEETIMGSFVHIAAFASMMGSGRLVIEDFAAVSGGVRLYTGNENYSGNTMLNPAVPYPYRIPVRGQIHLEKHCCVCANSVVLPNVTIGEGAIVGANSLVATDCKPWTVYMGSPARVMGKRPKDKVLELESQLRSELYDADGHYIPKAKRPPPAK
jgi:acetyltransferase-like isoleucine patch superfamily enzyme